MSEGMPEADNDMGTTPSDADPNTAGTEPIEPTEANPPPGETPPPDAESPRARRLARARDFAARLVRRGATRRATSIADEAERLRQAEASEATAEEVEPTPSEGTGAEEGVTGEAEAATPPHEPVEEAEQSIRYVPLAQYLDRAIYDESVRDRTKELLVLNQEELLDHFLSTVGVGASESAKVAELMKSSNVRLIMKGLKDLGMPESKADEAHQIIMTEKGDIKVQHILSLGFSAEEAEAVNDLLNSSKAHHIKQELQKLGLEDDAIDQIIYVGNDEGKLVAEGLAKLGLEEHVISRILKFREGAKEEEARKKELGYDDTTRVRLADSLGITKEILDKAEKKRIPINLVIAAEQNSDLGLSEWLATNGIELPSRPRDETEERTNRKDRRQNTREKARVYTLYPYPPGHPLYGLGYSDHHLITRSETQYYQNMMRQNPGWLRNSLIRPGSLPLPRDLYHSRLTRPVLDVLNMIWVPLVGRRILVGQQLAFERRRHPNEDYGVFGRGREIRHHLLEGIKKVDTTITNDRSLLSRHRRHRNRSDIRRNPRLDLAQSIAEVKQKLQAYEMGRPELPDEDEYTYLRLQEQLQRPIDIDSKEELDRWIKQEVLFHELSEQHHSWYHEFEEGHSDLAEQLIEQRIETLRQLKLSDPQKFSDLRKDHPELFRVNGHDVRI